MSGTAGGPGGRGSRRDAASVGAEGGGVGAGGVGASSRGGEARGDEARGGGVCDLGGRAGNAAGAAGAAGNGGRAVRAGRRAGRRAGAGGAESDGLDALGRGLGDSGGAGAVALLDVEGLGVLNNIVVLLPDEAEAVGGVIAEGGVDVPGVLLVLVVDGSKSLRLDSQSVGIIAAEELDVDGALGVGSRVIPLDNVGLAGSKLLVLVWGVDSVKALGGIDADGDGRGGKSQDGGNGEAHLE